MNRTDRLYALVQELRAAGPQGRSSTWLARRFEVSARTIKRDIAALEEAGLPVWAVGGRAGGYRLLRHATLPPLTFTEGEATAIAVALAAEPDLPFGPDGRNALTKVLGAMRPEQRESAAALAGRIWMRLPSAGSRTATSKVLDEALRRQVVVHLDYRDDQGRLTLRRPVEPLAFARTGGHWYLLGWCRRREGGRWFRLDRIVAARATRLHLEARDLGEVFGPAPDDAHPVHLEI